MCHIHQVHLVCQHAAIEQNPVHSCGRKVSSQYALVDCRLLHNETVWLLLGPNHQLQLLISRFRDCYLSFFYLKIFYVDGVHALVLVSFYGPEARFSHH